MSCEVCIGQDLDSDGIVEVLDDDHPVARKPHVCCECKGVIQPGQRYSRFVGKWEGEIIKYSTCSLCEEIRRVFTCGESWMWECLWEDMEAIAFPILTTATECFCELSPAAKAYVLERWQKWKGLR